MATLNDKKLLLVMQEISEKTNPFGINDFCLFYNLARNSAGRETLDLEFGIESKRVGRLVRKSNDFKKFDTKSSSHVRWERIKNDMV
ncbi:MAG: hypothetical protein M0R51_08550 [Clostridia bacterium]|jgi:hypothetical protein|nr:hypothetical protein [Clostridia bacterium]